MSKAKRPCLAVGPSLHHWRAYYITLDKLSYKMRIDNSMLPELKGEETGGKENGEDHI